MTWLAEWLKEIIFVVLLAAFIDLLLPNRSMERYVKLVVSLLILLTLIAPVMRLFAPDAERQLEMAFMDSANLAGQQSAGTEEILRQGEQMRMKREQEAIQWASEEAAKRMKDQIERATGQPVDRVVVRVDAAENDAEPSISSIDVYMSPKEREEELSRKDDQEASPGTPSRIAIAPVEPVLIEVSPREREAVKADDAAIAAASGGSSGREGGTARGAGPALEGDSSYGHGGSSPLSRQIADILSRSWGIPAEVVNVVLQEDAK